jgi:2-hydroxy-3-keto-5-methylthiopentenyl-1-phosphate phosphatase
LTEFFVDYDGTITGQDGFDVLVRNAAGDGPWEAIEKRLDRGEITVREALFEQAALVSFTLDEAAALLARWAPVDPTFADFVAWARERNLPLTIVSSGVDQLIERALERNGLTGIPVIANHIERDTQGRWIMRFRDNIPNGTDKAAVVRAAHERGARTIFIGDGYSDFDAALAADVRFAKRGYRLAGFLQEEKVDFSTFSSFHEIIAQLSVLCPAGR